MSLSQLGLGAGATACAIAGMLAIPHACILITSCCYHKSYKIITRDDDHETIISGKPPRSVWQRVCLVLVGAVGTTTAALSWMSTNDSSTVKLLQFVAWV